MLLAGKHVREKPHVVGVVCYYQKIQRPRQAYGSAIGRLNFLTAGKTIGRIQTEAIAEGAGIH